VVTNSGPGVSPAEQERYAAETGLRRMGLPPAEVESALISYGSMLESIRGGTSYEDFLQTIDGDDQRLRFDRLSHVAFVPDGEALWGFAGQTIDYDPRPAMREIRCPVLALFGAEDRSVPVEQSVRVYQDAVSDLAVQVFAGADHRCQLGDPPRMAPGYLDILAQEIRRFAKRGVLDATLSRLGGQGSSATGRNS
jgi:pimeloyl-ACP methyl ester carboxylesterase